jgi:glycine oxidase
MYRSTATHCSSAPNIAAAPDSGGLASVKTVALYSRNAPVPDVAIVGGGIIGLAVAWRARQRGLSVLLLDRGGIGEGASPVAAGMLAPVAEVEFGEAGRRILDLGLHSAEMWPDFALELEELAGVGIGLRRTGTLMVACDGDEGRELERQLAFRESLGVRALRLLPSEAREREPALAPTVRLALEAPDDHSLDPRRAIAALRRACERCGVRIAEHVPVGAPAFDVSGERLEGIRLADGAVLAAPQVVLATGAWSGLMAVLPESVRVPVRPVKGQTLRLRDPGGPGLVRRAVRREGVYLVPRDDGRYVLGATMEERGFELEATAGAAYELLRDAHVVVPGISELFLEEVCVGLRPGTPDNAPIIGRAACDGLIWATGHHRAGVLLAPLTGTLVADLLAGEPSDPLLSICDPSRFVATSAAFPRVAPTPG